MARINRSTLITGLVAASLALGWSLREAQFARAAGKKVPNGTVNISDVPLTQAEYEGKKTGQMSVLLDGETPANQSFQVGRFLLDPGTQPHPPHTHVDEELLLVTRGQGEIYVGDKTTPAKRGAVMYVDPNVPHGIKNTGATPLEFYWIKYIPREK